MKARLKSSPAARELIEAYEPFHELAQIHAEGHWVVGFGHRKAAREGVRVSRDEASLLLIYDVMQAEAAIDEVASIPLTDAQRDALVSFVHGIGVDAFARSDVARFLFEGRASAAGEAIASWADSASARHEAESQLFLKGPQATAPVEIVEGEAELVETETVAAGAEMATDQVQTMDEAEAEDESVELVIKVEHPEPEEEALAPLEAAVRELADDQLDTALMEAPPVAELAMADAEPVAELAETADEGEPPAIPPIAELPPPPPPAAPREPHPGRAENEIARMIAMAQAGLDARILEQSEPETVELAAPVVPSLDDTPTLEDVAEAEISPEDQPTDVDVVEDLAIESDEGEIEHGETEETAEVEADPVAAEDEDTVPETDVEPSAEAEPSVAAEADDAVIGDTETSEADDTAEPVDVTDETIIADPVSEVTADAVAMDEVSEEVADEAVVEEAVSDEVAAVEDAAAVEETADSDAGDDTETDATPAGQALTDALTEMPLPPVEETPDEEISESADLTDNALEDAAQPDTPLPGRPARDDVAAAVIARMSRQIEQAPTETAPEHYAQVQASNRNLPEGVTLGFALVGEMFAGWERAEPTPVEPQTDETPANTAAENRVAVETVSEEVTPEVAPDQMPEILVESDKAEAEFDDVDVPTVGETEVAEEPETTEEPDIAGEPGPATATDADTHSDVDVATESIPANQIFDMSADSTPPPSVDEFVAEAADDGMNGEIENPHRPDPADAGVDPDPLYESERTDEVELDSFTPADLTGGDDPYQIIPEKHVASDPYEGLWSFVVVLVLGLATGGYGAYTVVQDWAHIVAERPLTFGVICALVGLFLVIGSGWQLLSMLGSKKK